LSRIINVDSVGKQRKRNTREIVLAIRKLLQQTEITSETRDLAAFIALRLKAIFESIDITVAPWEKRDYWIKADRFRMEWAWSGRFAEEMREAVVAKDWPQVAAISAKTAEKLSNIQVPKNHRMGEPWHGAWQELSKFPHT